MKKNGTPDPNQMSLFPTGKQLRDEGIQRSEDHANRVNPGWSDTAFAFLLTYADNHRDNEFLCEDVRAASIDFVPEPPNTSAWGAVMTRAKKSAYLLDMGSRRKKGPKAHTAWGTWWKTNPNWTNAKTLNGKNHDNS